MIDSVRVRNARLVYRDRAIPGLGELEVKAGNTLLRRKDDVYRVDFNAQALGGPEENVEGWMVVPRGAGPGPRDAAREGGGDRRGAAARPDRAAARRDALRHRARRRRRGAGRHRAAGDVATDAGRRAPRARRARGVRPRGGRLGREGAGTALDVDLAVRAGGFGIAVDHASVASGDVRLVANLAEPPVPSPEAGQQPLVLALEGFDAARLAGWVPALAVVRPRGALFMEGRVTPGPDGVATDLRVAANELELQHKSRPITVASASLDVSLAHGNEGLLGSLRVSEVRSPEGTIASVGANVGGACEAAARGAGPRRPPGAQRRRGRHGAARPPRARRRLRDPEPQARGPGRHGQRARAGDARSRRHVHGRAPAGVAGLDLAKVTQLIGERDAGNGILAGGASLETSGGDDRDRAREPQRHVRGDAR